MSDQQPDTQPDRPDEVEMRRLFFESPAWDERYAATDRIWSGRVNPVLAAEAATLTPGRALDVGSGEGGDALWLAGRGWKVVGLEFSRVARERAALHAEEAGLADRTSWRDADVRTWDPGDEGWDLVTSHFFHQPDQLLPDVVRRLAAAVAPGGTLLVVGHHPADLATGARHGDPTWLFTAEELVPSLDPEAFEVEAVEARTRTGPHPEGGTVEWTDAVLRARRRSAAPMSS